MPATKSLRSGTCASTLLPMIRSARLPSATSRSASAAPEELDPRRDARLRAASAHVGGRLDAQHRHAQRQEMLQQVAVVAGELDDEAVARPSRSRSLIMSAVAPRVLDPARRVGREIGVFA